MNFETLNPYSEKRIGEYHPLQDQELSHVVAQGGKTWKSWKQTSFFERTTLMNKLARKMEEQKSSLAKLASQEMGKPCAQALAEVEKCVRLVDYYAQYGEEFLEDQIIEKEGFKSRVAFESLGVILGIMPWNFPYWQVFRFSIPTLMAGNTVLLKHAPNTLGCGRAIESLFKEAGFPLGVYQNIVVEVDHIEAILADERVQGVSLTGSTRAGQSVAQLAGKYLKKSVLELGGSDPYLVLEDAALELAIEKCSSSRMLNNGQSCVAAKRFIVHESLYEDFLKGMKSRFLELRLGDPLQEDTDLGPLARKDLQQKLLSQVDKAVREGARKELNLEPWNDKGFFVRPEILTGVRPTHFSFHEEFFGPVAMVFSFKKEEEALELANLSPYGLGGAVFSKDLEKAQSIARKGIQSGFVAVNDMVRSDPRIPFGGVKHSGYGRELGSQGIHEFVNIKTLNF